MVQHSLQNTDTHYKVISRGAHLNTLSQVLLLLRLEGQLNEQLLQLLVAVVDTELLEAVCAKDLKAVDVQKSHHVLACLALCVGTQGTVSNYGPVQESMGDTCEAV